MTEIQKRMEDLARRADKTYAPVYSDFLGLDQISQLKQQRFSVPVVLWGGFDSAERCVACFGDESYEDFPIKCLSIEPVNQKFADALSHRDFLGALINLGIRRDVLGDIIIDENRGYLFCLDTICDYISENLTKVRHTAVRCNIADKVPENAVSRPENEELIVSSERLDVIVSAVYSLSRNKSLELFKGEKVFVNGVITVSSAFIPKEGDKISVRGFGRFIYNGPVKATKKGRLVIAVGIYK